MARRDEVWTNKPGGYIQPIDSYDVLIYGTNKYLNFGILSGSLGYGFRDNNGVMEFKDSSGEWRKIWQITISDTAPSNPYLNQLWIDTS
jgi:hypothetical protein